MTNKGPPRRQLLEDVLDVMGDADLAPFLAP